jgi:catechol 2,3-dioxygenase-like lactoylglutathione lyase family enzyme
MKVKRIVANIDTQDIAAAKRFYQDVLGLEVLMDLGWIATYGSKDQMNTRDPLGKLVNILAHLSPTPALP